MENMPKYIITTIEDTVYLNIDIPIEISIAFTKIRRTINRILKNAIETNSYYYNKTLLVNIISSPAYCEIIKKLDNLIDTNVKYNIIEDSTMRNTKEIIFKFKLDQIEYNLKIKIPFYNDEDNFILEQTEKENDPFYSEKNIARLKKSIADFNANKK